MPAPTETIRSFFHAWAGGPAAMYQSFRDFFSPDAIWENIGIATTAGPEEAIAFFASSPVMERCSHMEVDIVNIASDGNIVMTERVDRFVKADGDTVGSVRVMGVFEVVGGKIVTWRDYFDPRPFADHE